MKRYVVWLLVVVFSLSMALMGIGCKEEVTPAEEEEEEVVAEEEEEEEEEETVELSGDVVYWSMWNETEPQAEVIKAAITNFEAENTEVNVTVQWNGREIRQILKAALDAGERIDVYENANLSISSAGDCVGGVFHPISLGLAMKMDFKLETQRDASLRATEIVGTMTYGQGVVKDNYGCQVTVDASL